MTYEERIEQIKQDFNILADNINGTLHTMQLQRKSDGKMFNFTISELYTIECNSDEYDEAFDIVDSGRTYTETANPKCGADEISDSEFVEMLEAVL